MSDEATYALAGAIERLANAITGHAEALTLLAAKQAVAGPPAASGPPAAAGGPPGREKTTEEKMAGKVFAICKQQGWDIADVGQRATGRALGADTRKWSRDDLAAVLDQLKEWGHP